MNNLIRWSLMVFLMIGQLYAQSGDTLVVQTFSFNDPSPVGWSAPYRGSFLFPDTSVHFEKILMYYTLKCDAATNHDGYPCGEWDYTTHTYVVDSSGVMDSTRRVTPNYQLINGGTPDSLALRLTPVHTYTHVWQPYRVYTDTLGLTSSAPGAGGKSLPLFGGHPVGRAQFIWTASELLAAGLSPGDITGLRLYLMGASTTARNLRIRIAPTLLDSLGDTQFQQTGFTEVYYHDTDFSGAGWYSFPFVQGYSWDGVSNLAVEFTYESTTSYAPASVAADTVGAGTGVMTSGSAYYLQLDGTNDMVDLGSGPQIAGTDARTIEMWAQADAFNDAGIFQAGPTGSTGADFSLRTMTTPALWRAQFWGTPDFDVTLPGSPGSWHHYAVTFDGSVAKIYFDGVLKASRNISISTGTFNIWLGRWSGSFFKGKLDEVRVWDKALDGAVIQAWKHKPITPDHPDYAHLKGWWPLDEGQGLTTQDASGHGFTGQLLGPPAWRKWRPQDITRDMTPVTERPQTVFEQGTFISYLDSTLSVDSVVREPVQVVVYNHPSGAYIIPDDHPQHPSIPTDTLTVWPAQSYTYIYDANGQVLDSVWVQADTVLRRRDHVYYSNIVWYEIGRFITPYGINLDLGAQGTRWVFDVTDYEPILHDWVYLQAGNNQELLDLKFIMIKGTPARTVRKIENLWQGEYSYADLWNNVQAKPVTRLLDPLGAAYRVNMRISGHGFGGQTDCGEFCPRHHYLYVNGNQAFDWEVWNECGDNFVYPQGGTWVYDRAGWCPGSPVSVFSHELTPLVTPGDTVAIEYKIQNPAPYPAEGNYVFSGQLVTYGPPNFVRDVSMEEIMAPTDDKRFSRRNPICDNPRIRIRNNGTEPLTQVGIRYGIRGGLQTCGYVWEGNLGFLESTEIDLPEFNWATSAQGQPVFFAELVNPNGKQDHNPGNNLKESRFAIPTRLFSGSVLEIRTNGVAAENSYTITDAEGVVVRQRTQMQNNTLYRDTLDLPLGCYTFHFRDDNVFADWDGNDGLSWWANSDGSGFVRIMRPDGTQLKRYNSDFGKDIWEQFTVLYTLGQYYFSDITCTTIDSAVTAITPPLTGSLDLYPNPAPGTCTVDIHLGYPAAAELEVWNITGVRVYAITLPEASDIQHTLNLEVPGGIYLVRVRTPRQVLSRELVITR